MTVRSYKRGAVYNEIDPFACQWMRNLISAGEITDGVVLEKSIADLTASDLAGYERVHMFAGIGGWDRALNLAGWPVGRRIWTGSAPCQPFSTAGRKGGLTDDRHLWPEMFRLLRECRPEVAVGEQVASPDGLEWLDVVFADLEAAGYACAAMDIPACSVGAPHERQRLYWVAYDVGAARGGDGQAVPASFGHERTGRARRGRGGPENGSADGEGLALANRQRRDGESVRLLGRGPREDRAEVAGGGDVGGVADPDEHGARRDAGAAPCSQGAGKSERQEYRADGDGVESSGAATIGVPQGDANGTRPQRRGLRRHGADERPTGPSGLAFWSGPEWLPCTDNSFRPTERGLFPLSHGLPRSMGGLGAWRAGLAEVAGLDAKSLKAAKAWRTGCIRGYGNAIVPPLAATFIRAFMETGLYP